MISAAVLWLALNVHHEARGEPFHCQVMIAEVTLRRVDSPYYPDTMKDVILEPKQYSWANTIKPDFSILTKMDKKAAIEAMGGYRYTTTELHYAANYIDNYWTKKMKKTIVCGGHTFYDNKGRR